MGKELDQILIDILKSNGFADILAHQISMQYSERLLDEFGNQITQGLDKYVKSTIEKYTEDYSTEQTIRNNIQEIFRRIGKEELLNMIRREG